MRKNFLIKVNLQEINLIMNSNPHSRGIKLTREGDRSPIDSHRRTNQSLCKPILIPPMFNRSGQRDTCLLPKDEPDRDMIGLVIFRGTDKPERVKLFIG